MPLSRRCFLGWCGCASAALLPAPLRAAGLETRTAFPRSLEAAAPVDYRLTPHYRAKSPLDDVLLQVQPGFDQFVTEKYAEEVESVLAAWTVGLKQSPRDFGPIRDSLAPDFRGTRLLPSEEFPVRPDADLYVARCSPSHVPVGREDFLRDWPLLFPPHGTLLTAEFQVPAITITSDSPLGLKTSVRYDFVATGARFCREQQVGTWEIQWTRNEQGKLSVRAWQALEETKSRTLNTVFADITEEVLGKNSSYRDQLLRGTDYWRTVLDAACGIDVYGNNGVACGDIDNDGFDDLYVCQPGGLPNRLYRNRGDGTFEDITKASGVGVLDDTACALFADVDNDGHQDLIVVRATGPLLFHNRGNARFELRPDAFRFAQPPQGTFTAAALADYDRDGWLDVYFCLYSYYQGLDQYRFPTPYYDAKNGPPSFLLHNNGDGTFSDVTAATGLNRNNNHYSFACGWDDYNNDGWPDLYVANDFGRKNLYRNNRDGTFTDVAVEAGVEDVGAGMSVCWFDYNADGRSDLYVADMWSAAGSRIVSQDEFMKGAPENVRALFRKHARGNSLFENKGNERFDDTTSSAGVGMGRWAWSSDSWDFDHDGYPDLYIANGMVSGRKTKDLSSFFWRQAVAQSPLEEISSHAYEQGWNAINDLIRSDGTWSGYERNTFYVNNRDGTFSDVSGAVGLDFLDDSRAFALADYDHDGRLEIFLKNRTSPQLRVLRNRAEHLGSSVAFRLRGTKSNRDAIGASITVETEKGRQVKFLQAGSGFLSQHTKEMFFGLGQIQGRVRASVRWPSELVQQFADIPSGHRIEIEEGSETFRARPFVPRAHPLTVQSVRQETEIPSVCETWLIDPFPAPEFALPDLSGRTRSLASFRGHRVLLNFWTTRSSPSVRQLELFQQHHARWVARGLGLLAVNLNGPGDAESVKGFVREKKLTFLIVVASEDTAGTYNVLYRYLFDRRRDLGVPTSFLLNEQGLIVKVYQGPAAPERLLKDFESLPTTADERAKKALPFSGKFYGGEFHRNHFSYGVAFFQRGYLDPARVSFESAIRVNPGYAEAHYNLGTIYLNKKIPAEARKYFQQALQLQPDYPDALNNLGLLAAEEGNNDEASDYFKQALRQKPKYAIALQNLGNLYRHQGRLAEALEILERALQVEPDDPELNYSAGMLYAQRNDVDRARVYLERALKLRPDYPEALNNLGVLDLRTGNLAEATVSFEKCLRVAPSFDQPYLNLARIYATKGDREKAVEVLRQLLKQNPNDAPALKALDELTR